MNEIDIIEQIVTLYTIILRFITIFIRHMNIKILLWAVSSS